MSRETTASNGESGQLAANRPTRSADRNREFASNPASDDRLLPSLEAGITLLDIEGRGVPVLQSVVLEHLLVNDGPAFWVDADGHATTTSLARIAPSQRLLDRIHVARGFTAYQHYGAVDSLPTGNECPSLVVAPALDTQYRAEDTLTERQAARLQARTLACLQAYTERSDVPVLVTRRRRDEFTAPVERVADNHLECTQTRMGPRFVGSFETRCYPVDGTYVQTTFAYWRELLDARARQAGVEPTAVAESNPDTVGTGVTAGGETATLTANPLLDAWAGGR